MAGRLSSPSHLNSKAGQGPHTAAGTPQALQQPPPASARNRPPSGRINQKYKQWDSKRQQQQQEWATEARTRPIRPDQPGYELTKRGRQQQLFDQLEKQYGPNFAETDVRLYLKKRQLNAARGKATRRGGFPVDDSLDKPGTFMKLSAQFQHSILQERSSALSAHVGRLPAEAAWKLYSHVPRLLTFITLEVAHKIRAMSRATGLHPIQVVDQLCSFKPLAFVHPGSLGSRLGLCAKLTRMNRQQAVQLMNQHPQLWMMNSRLVAPRAEELSLMLSCCSSSALKILASHPPLLTAQLNTMQQQLDKLSHVLGCGRATAELVPLLLSQPRLLLPPRPGQTASSSGSSTRDDTSGVQALKPQQQLDSAAYQTAVVPDTPEHLEEHLQGWAEHLQLPMKLAQLMVLWAPALLALPQSSTRSGGTVQQHQDSNGTAGRSSSHNIGQAVATAVTMLSSSWLCSAAATAQRQQYQQDIMRLLTPTVTRKKRHKAKQRQAQTNKQDQQQWLLNPQQQQQHWLPVGVTRYMAADADIYSTALCQWWTCSSNLHHSQQLTALQQLVIQAPGLLLQAASPPQASRDMPAASAVASRASWPSHAAAPAPGLDYQLDHLCLQLRKLLQANAQGMPQQQQQQQPTAALLQQHEQQVEASGEEQGAAIATEYEQLRDQVCSVAVLEPNLLAQPDGFMIGRVSELSRVLLMSPQQLWQVMQHCPAVLWLPGPQLFDRVRILCGVLRLSSHEVRQRLLTRAALPMLLLDVDAVKDAIDAVLKVGSGCGSSEQVARQVVQDRPELLLPGNIGAVSEILSSCR